MEAYLIWSNAPLIVQIAYTVLKSTKILEIRWPRQMLKSRMLIGLLTGQNQLQLLVTN